jgi:hypothetical protein
MTVLGWAGWLAGWSGECMNESCVIGELTPAEALAPVGNESWVTGELTPVEADTPFDFVFPQSVRKMRCSVQK